MRIPYAIAVTTANVPDRNGAVSMLERYQDSPRSISSVIRDGGYRRVRRSVAVRDSISASVTAMKRSDSRSFEVLPKR